jgi:tripartite-type tricarboxylate transporter receptor subunit TctC
LPECHYKKYQLKKSYPFREEWMAGTFTQTLVRFGLRHQACVVLSRPRLHSLLLAVAVFLAPQVSPAVAEFPDRTITIVVPSGAGGGLDLLGRFVAGQLTTKLQQSAIVENKTGAGTLVGTEAVSKATPDGYTLLVGGSSNMSLNPTLFKNIKYDAVNDFIPITYLVEYPMVLVARKDLPVSTFKELVDYAGSNRGKLSFASAGVGSGQHVWTTILFKGLGLEVTHVPFRGSAGAYAELLSGRVDLMLDNISAAQPQIQNGSLKPLAVSSTFRASQLPSVPTIAESGVDFEAISWMAIFAPRGTPPEIVGKLRASIDTIRASSEFQEFVQRNGGRRSEVVTDEQRLRYVSEDLKKWKILIERDNLVMQ